MKIDRLLILFTALLLSFDITSYASQDQAAQASMPAPLPVLPTVIKVQTVHTIPSQVTDAAKEVKNISGRLKPQVAFPGNIIRFTITNPMAFLKSRPTDRSKVVIYINGVELKGINAEWYSSVSDLQITSGKTSFLKDTASIDIVLRRDDSTRTAWNFFYNNTEHFFANHIDVDASVGWEGMNSLAKDRKTAADIRIIYYHSYEFWIWLAFFVLVLAGFSYLAFWTNAIRDGDKSAPYSLSLTQLLFWTTLVIGAFIYALVLTDITSSFNPSILYMLGISLGTTGAATLIDSRFKKDNPASGQKPHSNFFQDVLSSDGTSFSVQRIQIFAWNLLLGVYFIFYTINNKTMPEFSTTLLFMAGFSSLSYLGAKPPENTLVKSEGAGKPGAESLNPVVSPTPAVG